LQPVIDEVGIEKFVDVVIAYEPVWAIGTGKTASSEMAQESHQFIRQFIAKADENVADKVPLLYGGSVNASNCEELFAQADIDGGLIGGASLKAEQFIAICSAAKGK
jgi:triosephosphate isomerase